MSTKQYAASRVMAVRTSGNTEVQGEGWVKGVPDSKCLESLLHTVVLEARNLCRKAKAIDVGSSSRAGLSVQPPAGNCHTTLQRAPVQLVLRLICPLVCFLLGHIPFPHE